MYSSVYSSVCLAVQNFQAHLVGKIHKKKLSMTSSATPAAPGSVHYRCEVCEVVCTGKDNLEAHLQGAKHKKVGSGEEGKGRCRLECVGRGGRVHTDILN